MKKEYAKCVYRMITKIKWNIMQKWRKTRKNYPKNFYVLWNAKQGAIFVLFSIYQFSCDILPLTKWNKDALKNNQVGQGY